jgi:hypothetical protein
MNFPLISPALVFAFVLATLYGLVFFLMFGHGWARLGLYWIAALFGFAAGQGMASAIGLGVWDVGAVHLVEGTVASALCLLAVRALGK